MNVSTVAVPFRKKRWSTAVTVEVPSARTACEFLTQSNSPKLRLTITASAVMWSSALENCGRSAIGISLEMCAPSI
jgi:hypothetical protein